LKCEDSNAFDHIETTSAVAVKDDPMPGYMWEQSTVSSLGNPYWIDAAGEIGDLDLNDSVFGKHCTICISID
jgi:hypothetical protein